MASTHTQAAKRSAACRQVVANYSQDDILELVKHFKERSGRMPGDITEAELTKPPYVLTRQGARNFLAELWGKGWSRRTITDNGRKAVAYNADATLGETLKGKQNV